MCNCSFGKFMLLMFVIVVGWPILGPIALVLITILGSICLVICIAVGFVKMCLPCSKAKPSPGKGFKAKKFTFKKS